jgi:hypothetical protein
MGSGHATSPYPADVDATTTVTDEASSVSAVGMDCVGRRSILAGVSISIAIAANNSSDTKARAAAASSCSAAAASSQAAAAQSASAAAQSAAESLASEASSEAQAASEDAAAAAMNLHSGETASLTSTNDDGTTSDFTMTVVIHPNARPTGEFTTPAEKGQYVVADVTIKVTSGSYSHNPFDFQEQSGNGQIWQLTFAIGFDPALNAGTAAAGHTARGNVVFDVPRGPIQIQLTGGFGQSTAAAWNG